MYKSIKRRITRLLGNISAPFGNRVLTLGFIPTKRVEDNPSCFREINLRCSIY